ncbi:MAG: AB hydrolase-1 domain-containing protein [Succiniclasticum sp.]|jgi:pimeloyl-ACP methyl ester carboxylesterase
MGSIGKWTGAVLLTFALAVGETGLFPGLLHAAAGQEGRTAPLVLAEQRSFTVGGTTVKHSGTFSGTRFLEAPGQSAFGDHAYVFYQKPVHANPYPIIFQHGGAQSKRTWETTPDGREGFQNLFLRKGYSVYVLDQPRIGEAGLATVPDDGSNPYARNPMYADKALYMLSRVGTFDGDTPVPFPNAAVPHDAHSYDQFQRTWTPYEGKLDDDVSADALAALFEKTGPAILVTHSMGGTVGWRTPFRTDKVKAIIALEPGGSPFLFPEGEVPAVTPTTYAPVAAQAKAVPLKDFEELTKIPIILYYGDNIATGPSKEIGPDKWRSELMMAKEFVAAVNRHGGKASLVHLPDIGIRGNTHFLMADLNNKQIADLMARWLHEQGLD